MNKCATPEAQAKRIASRIRNGNLKHTEESKQKIREGMYRHFAIHDVAQWRLDRKINS